MSHKPILEKEILSVTVRGRLDCVSFSANSCQIINDGRVVPCTFPDGLKPTVKDALGDLVEVLGDATLADAGIHNPVITGLRLQQVKVLERDSSSGNNLKPVTAQLLRDLDLYRLGDDREDVGDAVEMVRQLREQSWGGRS